MFFITHVTDIHMVTSQYLVGNCMGEWSSYDKAIHIYQNPILQKIDADFVVVYPNLDFLAITCKVIPIWQWQYVPNYRSVIRDIIQ